MIGPACRRDCGGWWWWLYSRPPWSIPSYIIELLLQTFVDRNFQQSGLYQHQQISSVTKAGNQDWQAFRLIMFILKYCQFSTKYKE